MKKRIIFVLLILSTLSFSFAEEHLVSFSAGISSGVPFYGSDEVKEIHENLSDGSRVIIGGLASLNINPIKQVTFFAGADLLCDLNKQEAFTANHLSFDIPFGLKLYPGIDGLCVGVAYAFGFRADFYNLVEDEEIVKSNSPWGNGFKFLAEYNFAHEGKSSFLPTIGMYWKRMPRGNNNFDNHICAYVCMNL